MTARLIHALTADIEARVNEWLAANQVQIVSVAMSTHIVPNDRFPDLPMPYTNVLIIYNEVI